MLIDYFSFFIRFITTITIKLLAIIYITQLIYIDRMESQIFCDKIKNIIMLGNSEEQLKILKIYPIFKIKVNIFHIWLEIYSNINKDDNQIIKDNTINFICLGLLHNLIKYENSEIFALFETMRNMNEDEKDIDLIKNNISTCIHNLNIQKLFINNKVNVRTPRELHNITLFQPIDIANAITVEMMNLLKIISYHELISISLDDKIKFTLNGFNDLPSLKMIYYFHKLSRLVPTIILLKNSNNDERSKTIKYFLKVCVELRKLNNYNALFAIVCGLNNIVIQKIKILWKNDKSHTKYFQKLCNLISPQNNYKEYRKTINDNMKNNSIPYIGIIISDLKHIFENNLYNEECTDFNWEICNIVSSILNNFKNIKSDYIIKGNIDIINYISSFVTCDDDDYLYEIALTIVNDYEKQI